MNKDEMLNTANVNRIFEACMITCIGSSAAFITVDGIKEVPDATFDTDSIELHHRQIYAMSTQLPAEFHGPGYTILEASITSNGERWADSMQTVERFVQLGIAAGALEYPSWPRREWARLAEGMPYIKVVH